jgi:hypothetical protein
MTGSARKDPKHLWVVALAALALTAACDLAFAQSSGAGTSVVVRSGSSAAPGAAVVPAAPDVAAGTADDTADGPVPDDPTIAKPKKKKTAAAPALGDQPPIALDASTGAGPEPTDSTAGTGSTAAAPPVDGDVKKMKKKHPSAVPATADAASVPPDPTETATTTMPVTAKKAMRKTADVSTDPKGPLGASGCRTRSFLVNDYGKDGPTADAKRLLDKDIADWSKSNGLQNVKVGTKSVQCEQFLNFIVFDEWTCTASAQVCWK